MNLINTTIVIITIVIKGISNKNWMILMKDSVNIGLIGFGTIGSGVVETFNQNFGICKPKTAKGAS